MGQDKYLLYKLIIYVKPHMWCHKTSFKLIHGTIVNTIGLIFLTHTYPACILSVMLTLLVFLYYTTSIAQNNILRFPLDSNFEHQKNDL